MKNIKELVTISELRVSEEKTPTGAFSRWVVDIAAKDVFNMVAALGKNPDLLEKNVDYFSTVVLGSDQEEWKGGSIAAFHAMGGGELDLSIFNKARDKLKDMRTQVQEQLAPIGRIRRRTMSEHDGEWIPERQWETQQFATTYKENSGILPTLQIDVDFSFHAGISAEDIAKFGAFCWAIVDAVESTGIQVGVALQCTHDLRVSGGEIPKKGTKALENIRLKEAGSYVEATSIARCFTPLFYRRGMFALSFAECEAKGGRVNGGIAIPTPDAGRPIVSPGNLFLRRDNIHMKPDALAKLVLQALGNKEEAHA